MIIEEVYDALIEAGATEDAARAAARALAGYENRFSQMDNRFSQIDNRFSQIDGSLALLKWMVGFNLGLTAAVLFRLLST